MRISALSQGPATAADEVHSVLQTLHDPYFVQQVAVSSELVGMSRTEVFAELLRGKRVLHVGYADWPITDLSTNLHVALDGVCAQLDGVDPHDEAAEALRPYVKGRLFTSLAEVTESYDVVLVPEVLEHVGDAEAFLAELSGIDFTNILITVPDAFSCRGGHFDHNAESGVFVEVVHPDHNYWFSPYTLTNIVQKHTDWTVDGLWFFNGISLLMLATKPSGAPLIPAQATGAAVARVPADPRLRIVVRVPDVPTGPALQVLSAAVLAFAGDPDVEVALVGDSEPTEERGLLLTGLLLGLVGEGQELPSLALYGPEEAADLPAQIRFLSTSDDEVALGEAAMTILSIGVVVGAEPARGPFPATG